jgi:hypothetical protein
MEKKSQTELCPKCDSPVETHQEDSCLRTQLSGAQMEIRKLKVSIDGWKDAWFHIRDLIGVISWEHHNCPHEVRPPPAPKPNRWLHPNESFVQVGTLVYAKTTDDWKVVGSSTSVDGAANILRLMKGSQ